MKRFHLITLFREACEPYVNSSIIGRAVKNKKIKISFTSPRDFADNKWKKTDERPYGGGPGMVMTALPVVKATARALARARGKKVIVWFTPGKKQFTNKDADALLKYDHIALVCGRYEGIDTRAKKMLKDIATVKEYAVGEAVYTGGEIPALAIIDATSRRIPGVLGKDESVEERRISAHDIYTRPEVLTYRGKKYRVPKILLSGHQANIDAWKQGKQ